VLLGTGPISWKVKKQPTVSRSSTKPKYRTMANATSEAVWFCNLLRSLHLPVPITRLYWDNQATLHITANPVFHECTKYIEINSPFVRNASFLGKLLHGMFSLYTNLLIYLLRIWDNDSFIIFLASWAF